MRFSFVLLLAAAIPAVAAEISVSWGTGPKGQTTVNTPAGTVFAADSSTTTLVDGSFKIFGIGPVSINWDIPVAFGGAGYANVVAQSGSAVAYVEKFKWAVTPGLKGRFTIGPISPWISFGAGAARLDRSGAFYSLGSNPLSQVANGWSLALSPAGGIDLRLLPIVFFRGEVRAYNLRPAESLFSNSNLLQNLDWRSNTLFLVGIGARF